ATVFTYNGTTTVASTTTAQVVPINATLPPGNYQMNLGTTVGTYRNSTGGVYPYTIPGVLSITGNTFDPVYYYMFYRWVVGAGCESPRVPVTAVVNPADPVTTSISPNDTICSGVTAMLQSSSSNPTYTYTWTDDQGNIAGVGSSVSVSPLANTTYYLEAVDGSNCSVLDTIEVTVKGVPPTTVTLASPEELCVSGDVSLSIDPTPAFGIEYQWQKDDGLGFVDIPGATTATYTDMGVSVTTSYQLQSFCDGALAGTSTPVTVEVNNPTIAAVYPGSRCDAGPVTLVATATDPSATLNWYDVATGGTSIGTGGAFVTPVLTSGTTTYYVAASDGGGTGYVGAPNNGQNTGYTLEAGLFFDAYVPFDIKGVYVYPVGT